jgi:hypothetical protein
MQPGVRRAAKEEDTRGTLRDLLTSVSGSEQQREIRMRTLTEIRERRGLNLEPQCATAWRQAEKRLLRVRLWHAHTRDQTPRRAVEELSTGRRPLIMAGFG